MKDLKEKLLNEAKKCIGTPYVWGGESPQGFDCSGLMKHLYRVVNKDLPRTTYDQIKQGKEVNKYELQIGDLLFFGKDTPIHVAMYIGNGQMIEAPHRGKNTRIVNINRDDYIGARRILN